MSKRAGHGSLTAFCREAPFLGPTEHRSLGFLVTETQAPCNCRRRSNGNHEDTRGWRKDLPRMASASGDSFRGTAFRPASARAPRGRAYGAPRGTAWNTTRRSDC